MGAAEVIGLIVLGVIAVAVIAVVFMLVLGLVAKLVLNAIKGPLESRIAARYRPDEVLMKDLTANTFGLESKGVWQGRGNGGLVLTADGLHFFMFVPASELQVPLAAITELSLTKSHLGKATIHDLLKVRFSVDGRSDSVAWYLADPRAWKERIEELRSGMSSQL